jgi:phenylacetate-CoA ligase
LRWLDTAESWDAMVADWMHVFREAGAHPGDRALFAFSFGPFLGFWLAFEAAQKLGILSISGGGMSSAVRVRALFENRCTLLCCTPTYALHLAEVARAEGFDPARSSIRTLIVAGEPGGSLPATRQRLAAAWNGAAIRDHHGMTEVGPVTYEPRDIPGTLAVFDGSFFVEVLEPDADRPVAEGQPGELVLTTLRRTGSPLIRYRTGDLVRARRHPARPTQWLLDGGILGRVDDMVVVRGINVYPTAVEQIVREVAGAAEFRVTHDARATLPELRLELESDTMIAARLAHEFHERLALRVPVEAVAIGSLPRFELKARRWQRLD